MAVGFRTRSLDLPLVEGTIVGPKWPQVGRAASTGSLWMKDMVSSSPHPDQPMLATQARRKIAVMNGTRGAGNLIRYVTNFPTGYQSAFNFPGTPTPVDAPSNSSVALAHLARTNPSRPHVSLPVFLFELKDLPGMLLSEGTKFLSPARRKRMEAVTRRYGKPPPKDPHNGTGSAVEYYFGWEPLFRDLGKMLDFGSAANQRLSDLKKLNANGGGRFTTTVSNLANTSVLPDFWINSDNSITVKGTKVTVSRVKRWVSDRKAAHPDTPKPSEPEMLAQAWRAVRGERLSFADAWEAFPWSWFIDWFLPIGDFLQSQDNTIPFVSSGLCVMCELTVKETFTPTSATSGITCSSGGGTFKMMERVLLNPFTTVPEFRVPFLNGRQLSILSSIAFSVKR